MGGIIIPIIYILGYFVAYFMIRKVNPFFSKSRDWFDIVITFILSFLSWSAVVFIIFMWFFIILIECESEPPKWL